MALLQYGEGQFGEGFYGRQPGGFDPADRRLLVYWEELEVADVARALRDYWEEFEVPEVSRRLRDHWEQFEVPQPVRRLLDYWEEFEVPDPNRRLLDYWEEFEVPSPGGDFGPLVGEPTVRATLAGPGPYYATLTGGDMTCRTANPVFEIKQNETRPLRALAEDGEGNRPDLAGATALFRLADANKARIFEKAAVAHATIQTDPDGDPYNLEYLWAAGDLDLDPGGYLGEFVVTLASGAVIYVPSGNNYIKVALGEEL